MEKKEQSRTFHLSSDDQFSPESSNNSDFKIYLREKIDSQRVKRIIVKDVTVPNVFYNIRSSQGEVNNTFQWETAGVPFSITIDEGQYTIDSLCALLETKMQAASTQTFTIDRSSSAYQISQKLIFNSSANLLIYGGNSTTRALNTLLGFRNDTATATTVTADSVADLSGIPNVFVQSQALAPANSVDGDYGVVPILESVSLVETPFGATAYRQNDDSELNEIRYGNLRNLSEIDISLVDKRGNKLDIGVHSMSLTLKVFY